MSKYDTRGIVETFQTTIAKRRSDRASRAIVFTSQHAQFSKDTALVRASERGDIEEVRRLIKTGVNVDEPSGVNKTALKMAAKHGHLEIAKMLVRVGANVNYASDSGGTALMLAAGYGHAEIVRLFLDAGADVDARTKKLGKPSQTALSLARHHGHGDIVHIILDRKQPSPQRRGFSREASTHTSGRSP